ncbi:MAG: EAL domain-containing protein [Deltaproteobacteria bacterium]|nr:EAL domain-containing protein [Deltaproteobacteria bacterium]
MSVSVPQNWFLEGYLDESGRMWRTPLTIFPFMVGRGAECNLVLSAVGVSQRHAELWVRDQGELWVRDRGSRNGTSVNGVALQGQISLKAGDLLKFANQEFRVGQLVEVRAEPAMETLSLSAKDFEPHLLGQARALQEMLDQNEVRGIFQPIVDVTTHVPMGYEQLGRGRLGKTIKGPGELFPIAESMGLEQTLTDALRRVSLEQARLLPADKKLFVNTHPREIQHPEALLAALEKERRNSPDRSLVVEIHESAVTDLAAFRQLHQALGDLDVEIAFDDFGIGQARLIELADATPHYLKFDIVWLSHNPAAAQRRRTLLGQLLMMARDLGITTVLEGVEVAENASLAKSLGFDLLQGYHFGPPAPVEVYR